jgi:hypothetical protein
MTMKKDKDCSCSAAIEGRLRDILLLQAYTLVALGKLQTMEKIIMADLSRLEAEVGEIGTATESAIALLDGLKAALEAAGTDPVKLAELADALDARGNALAEAVVRNTPAA